MTEDEIRAKLAANSVSEPSTGCRTWMRRLLHNGYGVVSIAGRCKVRVHRLAYELARGPIPDGLQIDHLCRNRACINPDHLEAVTREENIARGNAPHILNARKTHCKRGHPLASARINNRGERICRECESINTRARKDRLKDHDHTVNGGRGDPSLAIPELPSGPIHPRGFLPFWTEATTAELAVYGLSYILQQIRATNTYRPNIGQVTAAISSLEFAIRALADGAERVQLGGAESPTGTNQKAPQ